MNHFGQIATIKKSLIAAQHFVYPERGASSRTVAGPQSLAQLRIAVVPAPLEHQFAAGRLYACVSSRPGQCGRVDGYILEGEVRRGPRPRAERPIHSRLLPVVGRGGGERSPRERNCRHDRPNVYRANMG